MNQTTTVYFVYQLLSRFSYFHGTCRAFDGELRILQSKQKQFKRKKHFHYQILSSTYLIDLYSFHITAHIKGPSVLSPASSARGGAPI